MTDTEKTEEQGSEGFFIDPDATFTVTLWYEPLFDASRKVMKGARVFTSGDQVTEAALAGKTVQKIAVEIAGRDAHNLSRVLEDSSVVNRVTGNPMIRVSTFCRLVLLCFGRSWSASAPFSSDYIARLPDTVLRGIVRRWLFETGGRIAL